MNILAIGPFIGSFEQEIMSFSPYVRYLSNIIEYDQLFICGHSNRKFLYDFIPTDNHYSINEKWTRDDCKQTGYIHEDVISNQLSQTVKDFRLYIKSKTKCQNKDIVMYNLPYVKSTPIYSTIQKVYIPSTIPDNKIQEKDYIIYIPDESIDEKTSMGIYNLLISEYNVIVVGDCKTHIPEHNVIMKRVDYVEKVYELIYSYIQKAKFVITPCSYWTIICNIQNIPVFSWGNNPSVYKTNGTFGFDNNNTVIYADEDTKINDLIRSMKYFEEKI